MFRLRPSHGYSFQHWLADYLLRPAELVHAIHCRRLMASGRALERRAAEVLALGTRRLYWKGMTR
jgi:hypothetical protein